MKRLCSLSSIMVVLMMAAFSAAQTTVTWAMWGSPEEIATHQKVADAFMAEYPDITIDIWSQPWGDYFTKLQTLWAAGDASVIPDVMFLSPVVNYAADGVLENLDPYIAEAGYDLSDYWPGLLDFATYDDHVYGFPRDIGLEVLYYNKDLFDEAGLEYPNDTWTWDDLKNAAETLTEVTNSGRVVRHGLAVEGGKYQLWVGQNKGSILDDMRNPSRCTLNDPEAAGGIQFFADLMNDSSAMRDANLSQAGGDAAVFQSGQAAMIIQNSSRITGFNDAAMNYDVAVVPIPEDGQRSASAAGAAWTMSSVSDTKDAAWTFLSWLQSTDGGQAIYTASGEILPALKSTAESDAFMGSTDKPENKQAFIVEGENAKVGRAGFFPEWNELSGSILSPALQRIWSGEAMPEEVLPGLCKEVDAFLAQNGYPK
ncbi:sugar ABC transporter substrate-binding protein [soil metagenome]